MKKSAFAKVVEEYESAKCASCAGSGKMLVSPNHFASCIVCGGKGNVSLLQPVSVCSLCDGTGKRSAPGSCFICSGSGWEHVPENSG